MKQAASYSEGERDETFAWRSRNSVFEGRKSQTYRTSNARLSPRAFTENDSWPQNLNVKKVGHTSSLTEINVMKQEKLVEHYISLPDDRLNVKHGVPTLLH